jgi:hypothetical protein
MKNSAHRCKLVLISEIWLYTMNSHCESCRYPIQTPSAQPIATRKRPSCVSVTDHECYFEKIFRDLTERHGASDVASEENPFSQSRIWTSRGWRNSESMDTETFNFKHLVRFLDDFPQSQRFFQLAFPFPPRRGRFSTEDVWPAIPSVVLHVARVHATSICGFRTRNDTYCI